MKECSICNTRKDFCEFNKAQSYCKDCHKKKCQEYYQKNKEKAKARALKWRSENYDKALDVCRKSAKKHRELGNHLEANRKNRKKRYDTDPEYKLKTLIRVNCYRVAKAVKQQKEMRSLDYLGCSLEEFKSHIESLWLEGMTWENHGDWHIDHKVPLDWYLKNSDDPWEANHYSNLQPLWAEENLSKGSSI